MPRTPCLVPLCPEFAVYRGRCEAHATERNRETHSGPSRAVYGSKRWKLTRNQKLGRDPLCEECGSIAAHVDHITAIEEGGESWAFDNLASLCAPCHGRKTAQEVRERRY